jgi:hypothetical protein
MKEMTAASGKEDLEAPLPEKINELLKKLYRKVFLFVK